MKEKGNKIGSTIVLLMIANFIVKFFGLLREILIAKYYGTSDLTDAYIIAHNIPTILFSMIAAAIATTFIPMYSRVTKEVNEKRANSFTLHLLKVLIIICFIVTIVGEILIKQVVWVFAPGFIGEKMENTVLFARILFPSLLGMTLFDLFGSYLQQQGKFKPLAVVPVVGNIVIILSLFASNIFDNILLFVWGTLIGLVLQVVFYLPWITKCGLLNAEWEGAFKDIYLKKMLPLIVPVIIGSGINEINSLIDKSLVSGLETGSVTALNYSYKIIILVVGVLVGAMTTVLYPKLAMLANDVDGLKFVQNCKITIETLLFIMLPVSIFVITFRSDIIAILFQRGNFNEYSTNMTASSLLFYSIGLSAYGLRDILIRIFYCKQSTRIPMINGIICACINIILDIVLIKFMYHNGAALATSISAIVGDIILLILLKRKGIVNLFDHDKSIIKVTLSAGIIAVLAISLNKSIINYIPNVYGRLAADFIVVLLCVCVYFGIQYFINRTMLTDIFENLNIKRNI